MRLRAQPRGGRFKLERVLGRPDVARDVIEALITTYKRERQASERFVETVRRVGFAPFKQAADAQRRATAAA